MLRRGTIVADLRSLRMRTHLDVLELVDGNAARRKSATRFVALSFSAAGNHQLVSIRQSVDFEEAARFGVTSSSQTRHKSLPH